MTVYGYARVSSVDQKLEDQLAMLSKAGCDVIKSEMISARKADNRPELQTLLAEMVAGDSIVVTRIDRLARSVLDLSNIVNDLRGRGIAIRAVLQSIDTSTSAGMAFLQMLGVFAEFENEIRRERQAVGIARAKAAGVYEGKGRPISIDAESIKELIKQGVGPGEIAKRIGCSRGSVYRLA
jgi:DNA invertase Pin-like site-specific DNA recombinase